MMLGFLLVFSRVTAIVLGGKRSVICQFSDSPGQHEHDIMRGMLTPAQRAMVDIITEMIIPATHSPGARAAGVAAFVEEAVFNGYTSAECQVFLTGLAKLEQAACAHYHTPFLDCDHAQQTELLRLAEKASQDAASLEAEEDVEGRLFFAFIKRLTIIGFFTSEIGCTQVLRYLPNPGYYDGNYPLHHADTQWSY